MPSHPARLASRQAGPTSPSRSQPPCSISTRVLESGRPRNTISTSVAFMGSVAMCHPSGSSQYVMYRDETANPPALVCVVGKTELRYQLRAIDDLHAMLKNHGDWIPLGSADEQKPAAEGTVEAWGRSQDNPVGGWYGMKKGLRGRFGMYMPPLLEALGLAEVEHNPRNNRMRAP